jgi:hypothetical protein
MYSDERYSPSTSDYTLGGIVAVGITIAAG